MTKTMAKVCQPWADRAAELASWAFERAVNRTDVWGGYIPLRHRQPGKQAGVTKPPKAERGEIALTCDLLGRHFRGASEGHVIGTHAISRENTSLWGLIDIDRHGDGPSGPSPDTLWTFACAKYDALVAMGFRPLLSDSNGKGGYHLRILFAEAVQSGALHRWLVQFVSDFADFGLADAPEVFPKQEKVTPQRPFGNWARLPGRHHTRDHWTRVWDAEQWLEADDGINIIVSLTGDDPGLLPFIPPPAPKEPRAYQPSHNGDLGAVLNRARLYLGRIEPAVSGQRGDYRTYYACCRMVQGFGLSAQEAFPLVNEWNQHCEPPWSEADLWRKLHDAENEEGERGFLLNAERRPGAQRQQKAKRRKYENDAERPRRRRSASKSQKPIVVTAARLAKIITHRDHFARDAGNLLYVYDRGVYIPRGERHVKAQVKRILDRSKQSDEWYKRLGEDVTEYITVDAAELWEQRHPHLLNVHNGLLDMYELRLTPHTPEHLSALQLPVAFDHAANCPKTERFVGEVFPADSVELAWEIAAFLILAQKNIQKAVLLQGEGENGKSTYLKQLAAFVGLKNIAAISLHRLESDKFSAARLVGKLANICADLPSRDLAGTSTFKALTGDEFAIPAERKFKDSFEFVPFCKLLFSANQLPTSPDAGKAFFRRWLVVPFERAIAPEDRIPAAILDAALAARAELSGLLNRALAALPALEARKDFLPTASTRRAHDDFVATTDPLRIWIETHTQEQPHGHVSKIGLRTAYNAWASEHAKPAATANAITRAVKATYRDVQEAQRDGREWVWLGIGLTANR